MNTYIRIFALVLWTMLLTAPNDAAAASYPDRPVRIVVAYTPGGLTDFYARTVARYLSQRLGQPFIVENKPGASGLTGTAQVAKAPADGYTLTVGTAITHAIAPFLFRKMPYDLVKDFESISLVGANPNVLVVNPQVPATSVQELIRLARSTPGGLAYASSGIGGTTHLSMEFLKQQANLQLLHVPYKGGSPAVSDVIGGQVPMMFDSVGSALPFVKSGKLKALAVTSANRIPLLPDVPTIQEAGFPAFEAIAWSGLHAPAGTPKEIIQLLNREVVRILAMPEVRELYTNLGAEPRSSSPQELDAFMQSEMKKWATVIKNANVTLTE